VEVIYLKNLMEMLDARSTTYDALELELLQGVEKKFITPFEYLKYR
jgi:hypothetical protein